LSVTYRQTFVIEYENSSHAPRVGANLEMLGGKLYAVQFSDAMEENELWREHATDETRAIVDRILSDRWAANHGA
jgi:hypothetical protein